MLSFYNVKPKLGCKYILHITYPHIHECRRRGIEARVKAKGGNAVGGSSSSWSAPLTSTSGIRRCRPLIITLHFTTHISRKHWKVFCNGFENGMCWLFSLYFQISWKYRRHGINRGPKCWRFGNAASTKGTLHQGTPLFILSILSANNL